MAQNPFFTNSVVSMLLHLLHLESILVILTCWTIFNYLNSGHRETPIIKIKCSFQVYVFMYL